LIAAALLVLGQSVAGRQAGPPYRPEAALSTFRLAEGLQIELFAAEPLISDPVAMEVDEQGRVYVVEMHGYPLDVSGTGRVILLRDADGDGRPDRSTIFADGLRLPTGIMRWKKGVLVTDPPDVLYLEDTNGDGRADIKRVVLTGFARTNPQHTMNTPLYALDNWIYLANEGPVRTIRYHDEFGDPGREVQFADRADAARLPADAGGRAVRFKPDTLELEMLSSRTQYGHTFDEYGHHFLNTNNRHMYQEVVAARYASRNPAFVVPSVIEQLPDYRQPADVFPITKDPEFQLLTDIGVMTSASGLTSYLGDLFPPDYRHAAFVAESAHNLVHAASVREQGATFRASRMFDGREFLASTDSWFRPVSFYIGPDGALYVIDYYREVIEHPEWLDDATAKSPRLYAGNDRGRIYRIVPTGTPPPSWMNRVNLADASTPELVNALGHTNIWWRRTAQRLLVDRNPKEAIGLLASMAAVNGSPIARVHALWTLEGLHRLDVTVIESALADENAGVRENAIQLAELHLRGNHALAATLLSMHDDPHPRVRFQLLLTLGNLDTPEATSVRQQLLFDGVEDQWMQVAALSAAGWDAQALWRTTIDRLGSRETAARRALFVRIGSMAAAGKQLRPVQEIVRAAGVNRAAADAWWRAATLEGLAAGMRGETRPGAELDPERALLAAMLFNGEAAPVRRAGLQLLEVIGVPADAEPLLQKAERLIADTNADTESRVDAVRFLAIRDVKPYETLLRGVLTQPEPAPLQVAAVRALGDVKGPQAAATFVELWDRWTPAVRNEATRALVREPARIRVLLDAVAAGRIKPTEIDRGLRIRLMMNDDDEQRRRARTLFAESAADAHGDTNRADVVARYQVAATASGDRERGREVFTRVCSTCHQYRGSGGAAFGPDLGEVRNRLPAALILDILLPNQSIADRYELWTVELSDGTTLAGIVGDETPDSVTFRMPGGGQSTVPRHRISSMRLSRISAMPDGLESQVSVEQMADLIAFLKGG
jgi:putative membrane-bound dehydrogenase-like protein